MRFLRRESVGAPPLSLARRCVGSFHGMVNRGPAKGCVWPVIAPAQAFVRAGAGLRGDAVLLKCFELGLCLSYVSIEMFDVRPTPAVCRTRQTGTACGRLRSYSARVEIAGRAFSNVMRLSNLLSSLQACAFFSGDPDGGTESTARQSTFLRKHLVLAMLSAGRTLGLKCGSCTAAAPDCAKETSLPGLSSFDSRQSISLSNLAITAILELSLLRPATLGYMERPARLQFMVGQVGLYSNHINTHNRRPA